MNNFMFIADNDIDLFNSDIHNGITKGNDIVIPSSSSINQSADYTPENSYNYTPFIIGGVIIILIIAVIAVLFKNTDKTKYSEISSNEIIQPATNRREESKLESVILEERPVSVKKSSYATPSSVSAAIKLFLEKTKNK